MSEWQRRIMKIIEENPDTAYPRFISSVLKERTGKVVTIPQVRQTLLLLRKKGMIENTGEELYGMRGAKVKVVRLTELGKAVLAGSPCSASAKGLPVVEGGDGSVAPSSPVDDAGLGGHEWELPQEEVQALAEAARKIRGRK